jgi:hypothetical protein
MARTGGRRQPPPRLSVEANLEQVQALPVLAGDALVFVSLVREPEQLKPRFRCRQGGRL